MGRFFAALILLFGATVAAACAAQRADEYPEQFKACPRIGGTVIDGFLCYVDSFTLVSVPDQYCSLPVATFGYANDTWAGVRLYPDKARAEHQQVTSSILIRDTRAAAAIKSELSAKSTTGIYVEITATFQCSEDKFVDRDVGVGQFVEVVQAAVNDVDQKGEFIRQRIIDRAR